MQQELFFLEFASHILHFYQRHRFLTNLDHRMQLSKNRLLGAENLREQLQHNPQVLIASTPPETPQTASAAAAGGGCFVFLLWRSCLNLLLFALQGCDAGFCWVASHPPYALIGVLIVVLFGVLFGLIAHRRLVQIFRALGRVGAVAGLGLP